MKQSKLHDTQISSLCRVLAYFCHAGVSPGNALASLADDETAPDEKKLLSIMAGKADEGLPLDEIFRQAECFPDYVCSLLSISEQLGCTENALNALADYYDSRARMTAQMKRSLLYPAVLLAVMSAVIVILLGWVLPVFNDVYARLGSSLTGLAGGLLTLGILLRKAMPFVCVLLVPAAAFGVFLAFSPGARGKLLRAWDKAHGDKGVFREIHTARFMQALVMGMNSGLNDSEAAELASRLAEGSDGFQKRCTSLVNKLYEGAELSTAMREAGLLSSSEYRLLTAGTRSGSREQAMEQIARHAIEESEQALEDLTGRIEPAAELVMSVLIGVILLSVMLPLMNIMTTIG